MLTESALQQYEPLPEVGTIYPWMFSHNIDQIREALSEDTTLLARFESALQYYQTHRDLETNIEGQRVRIRDFLQTDKPLNSYGSSDYHFVVHPRYPERSHYVAQGFSSDEIDESIGIYNRTMTALWNAGAVFLEPDRESSPEGSNILYTYPTSGRVVEDDALDLACTMAAISNEDSLVIGGSEYDRCTLDFVQQAVEAMYLGILSAESMKEHHVHEISDEEFEAEMTMREVLTRISFYKQSVIRYGTVSNARPLYARRYGSAASTQLHGEQTVILPKYAGSTAEAKHATWNMMLDIADTSLST